MLAAPIPLGIETATACAVLCTSASMLGQDYFLSLSAPSSHGTGFWFDSYECRLLAGKSRRATLPRPGSGSP